MTCQFAKHVGVACTSDVECLTVRDLLFLPILLILKLSPDYFLDIGSATATALYARISLGCPWSSPCGNGPRSLSPYLQVCAHITNFLQTNASPAYHSSPLALIALIATLAFLRRNSIQARQRELREYYIEQLGFVDFLLLFVNDSDDG